MSNAKEIFNANLQAVSERVGISEDELRSQLESVDLDNLHNQVGFPQVTDAGSSCKNIDFDIKIFAVKGKVCFTPGANWSLTIDLKLYLAGIELAHVKYNFSAKDTHVCYSYDVLVGSLKVCFGVKTSAGKVCLFTSGKACAVGKCTSWDQTLVCF